MLTLGMFSHFYETPYGRDVRSRIIIKGLKRNGVNIVDVRKKASKASSSLWNRAKLFKEGMSALKGVDAILVGWPA